MLWSSRDPPFPFFALDTERKTAEPRVEERARRRLMNNLAALSSGDAGDGRRDVSVLDHGPVEGLRPRTCSLPGRSEKNLKVPAPASSPHSSTRKRLQASSWWQEPGWDSAPPP